MTIAEGGPIDISQVKAEVRREVAKLRGQQPVQFHDGPRCRICRDQKSRDAVNKMLANAMSYPEILEMCELTINPRRAKNAQINYAVIKNHARRHFNVEEPAKAAYRAILERRAAEQAVAMKVEGALAVEGITRLITAWGFLDVVAQKGYETLVREETVVPVALGMDAVVKLHELLRPDAGDQENARLKAQLAIIQGAVKEVVPEEYWGEIIARIEDAEIRMSANVVDAEVLDDYDDYGDDEEGYSPPAERDADDTLERH